jgi:hypothetical protein
MPRRVESLNAAKVASNEGRVYLAMWISINLGGGRVKSKGSVRKIRNPIAEGRDLTRIGF